MTELTSMITVSGDTHKTLKILKAELELKTINDVIELLIKRNKDGNNESNAHTKREQ